MVGMNPLGHASMHAIHTALLYLAIEPYVRRIWPRALIGWARLSRGQWRDPVVARETLIGLAAPLLAAALLAVGTSTAQTLTGRPVIELYAAAQLLGDSAGLASTALHAGALVMFFTMVLYFVLLGVRTLVRRDWIMIFLVVVLSSLLALGSPAAKQSSGFEIALHVALTAALLTTFVWIVMRTGLIAAMVCLFVSSMVIVTPLTFDMSKFFAPQAMFVMLLFVGIAAYGFRYSLAGQSVFRDLLGDRPRTR
jgi:serine/threonine-protein kinase